MTEQANEVSNFKQEVSFAIRKQNAKQMLDEHPERIPAIILRKQGCKYQLPN